MTLPATCPSAELFEQALAGSSRALAGDPDLQLRFCTEQIPGDSETIQWPAAVADMAEAHIAALRGMCDAVAMKARYHDAGLHRSLAPAGPLSRAIADALEDLRVEMLAGRAMRGVADNLYALFVYKFQLRGVNVLETDAATSLANAVVLMVREHLLSQALPTPAKDFVCRWKDEILRLTGHDVDALCAATEDQAAFARLSLRLIGNLELADDPQQGPQTKPAEASPDGEERASSTPDQDGGDSDHADDEGNECSDSGSASSAAAEDDNQEMAGHGDSDPEAGASGKLIPFPQKRDDESSMHSPEALEGAPEEPDTAQYGSTQAFSYRVYTNRFDEVVHARDLIGKELQAHLRSKLDEEISQHRRAAMKLANRLQNSLRTLQKKAWTFDLDDGLLNTNHLSRLVIDPACPLVYKQERDSHSRDTIVTFLIDNSGSMRGRPIALAAMFTNILAQALERCQVSTEILGFTTRQWRGGQSGQYWRASGKPGNPGRGSDLRYVIYKTADEPWRRARRSLGAMLWADLLKENIDGEALLWAHGRLAGRWEQRRILVVISDGVPADDATLTANGRDYLEAHLRQVVDWIEAKSSVELLAIGIGHDVSTIYTRSVTIADSEQLGDAMAHELIELLAKVPTAARYPFAKKLSTGPTTLAG